jgi:hypothetical protein
MAELDPRLLEAAKGWTPQCGDFDAFASECAKHAKLSGETAFLLQTRHNGGGFPLGLSMFCRDSDRGETVLFDMDVTRPHDYKSNPEGFGGNHLVVAMLQVAAQKLKALVPEGVDVFTSRAAWSSVISRPEYAAEKVERALAWSLSDLPEPAAAPAKRARL